MARRTRARTDEGIAVVGAVLLFLGIWFLAGLPGTAEVGGPIGQFLANYWPLLLVILGLGLLAQRYGAFRR